MIAPRLALAVVLLLNIARLLTEPVDVGSPSSTTRA